MTNETVTLLPLYRCHKEVWALKIKAIETHSPSPCQYRYGSTKCGYGPNDSMHAEPGSDAAAGRHHYVPEKWPEAAIITPEEDGYAPFPVDADYLRKHNPHVGGYFVVYKDGYKSFSPAEAFEDGYSRV